MAKLQIWWVNITPCEGGPQGYLSLGGGRGVKLWCVSFRLVVVQFEAKKISKFNYAWCGDRCLALELSVKAHFWRNSFLKIELNFLSY